MTVIRDKVSGDVATRIDASSTGFSDPAATATQHTAGIGERTLVEPVEKRIAEINAMLSEETPQLDPHTRQPAKRISDPTRRAALEIELRHLQERELPYAMARAAQIAADRALLPSRTEVMREELERRARIQARASEIAEEQAAEDEAGRMAAKRQNY